MSLETQVADLVTATNSLTGTVNTKISDIDTAKNTAVATIATRISTFNSTELPAMQSSVDAVVNEFYNPNVRVTEKFPSIFHIGCGEDVTSGGRYGYATTEHVSQATSPFYAGAKFTGHKTYLPEVYIPYSLSTVMKMAISIYSIANADNGDTPRHYAGCAGYDKDLNFINVDGIGTYQYNLMANASIPVGTRLERDVTLKGWATSGSNTSMMDAGTVYIRPMILGNYQKAGAVSVLEGYTIMPAGTVADGDSNAGTNF